MFLLASVLLDYKNFFVIMPTKVYSVIMFSFSPENVLVASILQALRLKIMRKGRNGGWDVRNGECIYYVGY